MILVSDSLIRFTRSHPHVRVGNSGVGWIMFTIVDARLDAPEVLAIVMALILLAMVD